MWAEMWNWLVANGLLRDLVSAMVLAPIMHLINVLSIRNIRHAFKNAENDVSVVAGKVRI